MKRVLTSKARLAVGRRSSLSALLLLALTLAIAPSLLAKEKDTIDYGAGLIVNVPFPESEVSQAVQDVVQNGLIRGTKEYNKDEFITGATSASSSRSFPEWIEGGEVFYKQRLHTIDPRNFKDGGDVGTLTVRYVVQEQGEKNTVVSINAIFVEDFRHVSHLSNGSVESAEYKDIHDHIEAAELMKQQTAEAEREKERRTNPTSVSVDQQWSSSANTPRENSALVEERSYSLPAASASSGEPAANSAEPETLEQHVRRMRQQVERLVKSPGAPLKSAPFHTASTIQLLSSGAEVLIVISSPYWYGVETHDGAHGWIPRDAVELAP